MDIPAPVKQITSYNGRHFSRSSPRDSGSTIKEMPFENLVIFCEDFPEAIKQAAPICAMSKAWKQGV